MLLLATSIFIVIDISLFCILFFKDYSSSKPQLLGRLRVIMRFVSENVPALKLIDSCLRLSVIPLSLASICLAVNNHQDNNIYGKLEFSNFKGFK